MNSLVVPSAAALPPCEHDWKGVRDAVCEPDTGQDAASRMRDALTPLTPEVIARNRRRFEEQLDAKGIQPMTRERLQEVATGKDLIPDEEFEEYLAFINEQRGR